MGKKIVRLIPPKRNHEYLITKKISTIDWKIKKILDYLNIK